MRTKARYMLVPLQKNLPPNVFQKLSKHVRIGSVFTGTNLAQSFLQVIALEAQLMGLDMQLSFLYHCDNCKLSQRWLRYIYGPESMLVHSCEDLAASTQKGPKFGRVENLHTGELEKLPGVDILICAVSCSSMSNLNSAGKKARTAKDLQITRKNLRCLCNFIGGLSPRSPWMLFLENVFGFDMSEDSPYSEMVKLLKALGYCGVKEHISSSEMGDSQSRSRAYYIFYDMLANVSNSNPSLPDSVQAEYSKYMAITKWHFKPATLEDYILSADKAAADPWAIAEHARLSAKPCIPVSNAVKDAIALEAAFCQAGLPWPCEYSELDWTLASTWKLPRDANIDISCITTMRTLLLLYFKIVQRGGVGEQAGQHAPGTAWMIHTELSCKWYLDTLVPASKCPTLSPDAHFMLHQTGSVGAPAQFRELLPVEIWQLQGAPLESLCVGGVDLDALQQAFTLKNLNHLCGRAFHAPSFGSAFLAGMLANPRC